MPHKDLEEGRAARRALYAGRAAATSAYYGAKRKERRAILDEYKLAHGCARCGYDRCPAALEFHHRDPAQKVAGLSEMTRHSLARMMAEAAKCEVVCANCHREEHARERGWTPEVSLAAAG